MEEEELRQEIFGDSDDDIDYDSDEGNRNADVDEANDGGSAAAPAPPAPDSGEFAVRKVPLPTFKLRMEPPPRADTAEPMHQAPPRRGDEHEDDDEETAEAPLSPESAKRREAEEDVNAVLRKLKPKRAKRDLDDEGEMDETVASLLTQMCEAANTDQEFNKRNQPAIAKLRLLPSVMDLFSRVIMFYTKCERVTPQIRRNAQELLSRWMRPILKRSASYKDHTLEQVRIDPWEIQMAKKKAPASGSRSRPEEESTRARIPMPVAPSFSVVPVSVVPGAAAGADKRVDKYRKLKTTMKMIKSRAK
ncbi:Transcription factor iws1 [Polyrhizophydium stewartii]|uniref:Transcription factor iws1 n=1 Tax=Polyrhizophydium stewartii TaxID=2732419 RepID=A0ABR4NAR2_9FUNG